MLQSDIDHTKEDRSWMFYRFKAISSLDPYFFENYLYGGLYLSIIKNDLRGAEDIYNEGLKFYPSSLDLLWNAGFNLCFELKECPKAIPYFTKLINLDTDMRFKIASSILSKIHIKEENKKLGFMILYTSYQKMPDGQLKERVEKNLYELKKEIDYECFKGNETSCEDFDFFGKRYNFSK
ncbi:hypothetical protein M900_0192 [Bacteriovorax sp. Seq25_V]|nr:hypothetical protein M900_0192 [Bacteriovorax sp. Seq25_V]